MYSSEEIYFLQSRFQTLLVQYVQDHLLRRKRTPIRTLIPITSVTVAV